MAVPVIGGADGPTSIFLAGKIGMDRINIIGILIVVLILIPNIIYAFKFRGIENKCKNKIMNVMEQVGRYACMLFMIINVGEFGFSGIGTFLVYFLGNAVLLLSYWIFWILYFIKQSFGKSMALAIIPTVIFLLSAVTLQHVVLLIAAVLFGVGHIYVTCQNAKQEQ